MQTYPLTKKLVEEYASKKAKSKMFIIEKYFGVKPIGVNTDPVRFREVNGIIEIYGENFVDYFPFLLSTHSEKCILTKKTLTAIERIISTIPTEECIAQVRPKEIDPFIEAWHKVKEQKTRFKHEKVVIPLPFIKFQNFNEMKICRVCNCILRTEYLPPLMSGVLRESPFINSESNEALLERIIMIFEESISSESDLMMYLELAEKDGEKRSNYELIYKVNLLRDRIQQTCFQSKENDKSNGEDSKDEAQRDELNRALSNVADELLRLINIRKAYGSQMILKTKELEECKMLVYDEIVEDTFNMQDSILKKVRFGQANIKFIMANVINLYRSY